MILAGTDRLWLGGEPQIVSTHDGYSKGPMFTRPATLRLRFLRSTWPLKAAPRAYATLTGEPSAQTWPHQSQFGNIHDDQVARLAARPLHPLALADLVRYYPSHSTPHGY